jgi:ketosteroid isomerase-like protein
MGETRGAGDVVRAYLRVFETGDIDELDTVYFRSTYRHDATGRDIEQTGLKMYEVLDGQITRMWGETDLWGLMRQLGKVPADLSLE